MLLSLSIRNFVIVDQLELDFSNGLTVLSGETGAGKSILIDALCLGVGERPEASLVREGAEKADITANFSAPSPALRWLEENDLADGSSNELMIRRTIDIAGKSKAYINQTPVTATQLKLLGELLIDIHGQHAFQSLVKADEQRNLLDSVGGHAELVRTVAERFASVKLITQQLNAAKTNQAAIEEARERLAWQLEEIDKVSPAIGEWEALSQEHHRLSHAAELTSGTQNALNGLSESDGAIISQLSSITHIVEQLCQTDPTLTNTLEALRTADIHLSEASHELANYLRKADVDPQRLGELDERISQWHNTARKLRIPTQELAERAQTIRDELKTLDESTDIGQLEQAQAKALAQYTEQAQALSRARKNSAAQLGENVTDAMQGLNMTGGAFRCVLIPCEAQSTGLETIEFRVAGHAGVSPRPLAKVASGGELARISLAIAVIATNNTTVPTLIFDEVDSGIGGAVAEVIGRYLRQLAEQRQVLCVTHLPQVAAQGHHHWRVEKGWLNNTTTSSIRALDSEGRTQEIARMLGGQVITEKTVAAAAEMLKLANS